MGKIALFLKPVVASWARPSGARGTDPGIWALPVRTQDTAIDAKHSGHGCWQNPLIRSVTAKGDKGGYWLLIMPVFTTATLVEFQTAVNDSAVGTNLTVPAMR